MIDDGKRQLYFYWGYQPKTIDDEKKMTTATCWQWMIRVTLSAQPVGLKCRAENKLGL